MSHERRLSFYININNPHANRTVVAAPSVSGLPVEGAAKVCLVTAFTSIVGHPNPPYKPDLERAGKDSGFTLVSMGNDSVILPFSAAEFETLVLDAQSKNVIADFTHEHWHARLDDLAALNYTPRLVPR
jgi:hypothetical protein